MSNKRGQPELYQLLDSLQIPYDYIEHPPVPTVAEAMKYWSDIESGHCKNIFFRNHKGNRHYLVILFYDSQLDIRGLEQRLGQGKLTFASDRRLKQYLGLTPGSVSPFGLINDHTHHVHLFIDKSLMEYERLSFHPNINTASLIIPRDGLFRFIEHTGNSWEFI